MRAWTLILMAAAFMGCANDALDEYQPPDEKWDQPLFPDQGLTLKQTLNGIYAKRENDNRIIVQKIEILQTNVSPWRSIAVGDARGLDSAASEDSYAIIANRMCRSQVDLQMGQGQHVDWFILPKGRLAAFDHMLFGWKCAASAAYRPARGDQVEVEHALLALAKDSFPTSTQRVSMMYQRGIALARVGRVEEAEAILALGDEIVDKTTYDRIVRREGGAGANIARKSNREVQRKLLVSAIQHAKAGYLAPLDAAPAADAATNLESVRKAAEQRDHKRRERSERAQADRRYEKIGGTWRIVDPLRRRWGPGEGAVWVTFEEMQQIKSEEPELSHVRAKPPERKLSDAPRESAPVDAPLYVETPTGWIEVDAATQERGPKAGEVWLEFHEMEMLKLERQIEAANP